ncbi:Death-associated protein kinase dapk-1 [Trichinella pseudospiralis]|uniref:Death-associated protein kinase dapk-1 n=1 Tax=Trichinella pseudospiralis TaxID=6337 RepID=A0A0V1EWI9_TRIPS|nr:Death-associated protein kinase dapk-1 [Trichinella pseudospiralis]KRZ25674.1 Death-associated protein kinase dapk-1 [Trichinella pseudospiralis]
MQLAESVLMSDLCSDEELFLDVVCFGSKSIALSMTLGIDLKIISVPTGARCELARLLDLMDTVAVQFKHTTYHISYVPTCGIASTASLPDTVTSDVDVLLDPDDVDLCTKLKRAANRCPSAAIYRFKTGNHDSLDSLSAKVDDLTAINEASSVCTVSSLSNNVEDQRSLM